MHLFDMHLSGFYSFNCNFMSKSCFLLFFFLLTACICCFLVLFVVLFFLDGLCAIDGAIVGRVIHCCAYIVEH